MRTSLIILYLATAASLLAQEAAAPPDSFTPPTAYPVARYEAGWGKNPFTLKTAPAVVASVSFAKDLAIAGISGDTGNPTVTIVNTKTHERFRLKLGQPADNGMLLRDVKRAASRKDSFAEVVLGGETSKLTYDSSYLTQVASTSAARAPAPGAPNAPNVRLPIQPNASALPAPAPRPPQTPQAPKTATLGTRAPLPQDLAQALSAGNAPQGNIAPGAFIGGTSPVNLDTQPSISISVPNSPGTNLSVSVGTTNATSVTPGTTPSPEVVSAAPVPVRRRIITPITPPSNN
jgi:hypothetical protein